MQSRAARPRPGQRPHSRQPRASAVSGRRPGDVETCFAALAFLPRGRLGRACHSAGPASCALSHGPCFRRAQGRQQEEAAEAEERVEEEEAGRRAPLGGVRAAAPAPLGPQTQPTAHQPGAGRRQARTCRPSPLLHRGRPLPARPAAPSTPGASGFRGVTAGGSRASARAHQVTLPPGGAALRARAG